MLGTNTRSLPEPPRQFEMSPWWQHTDHLAGLSCALILLLPGTVMAVSVFRTPGVWEGAPLLLGLLPFLLPWLGLLLLLSILRKRRRTRELLRDGRELEAEIISVQRSRLIPRDPVVVRFRYQWPPGRWHESSQQSHQRVPLPEGLEKGGTLPLLIDPDRPTRHLVWLFEEVEFSKGSGCFKRRLPIPETWWLAMLGGGAALLAGLRWVTEIRGYRENSMLGLLPWFAGIVTFSLIYALLRGTGPKHDVDECEVP